MLLKFNSPRNFGATWECLGFLEQISLMGSSGFFSVTITTLPPLKPTDYLFEKYADKGSSKAEIYAWVARDIMARVSNKPKIEVQIRDKPLYKSFMTGKVDEIEYNGKKFTAKPMPSLIPCMRFLKKKKP